MQAMKELARERLYTDQTNIYNMRLPQSNPIEAVQYMLQRYSLTLRQALHVFRK